MPLAVRQQSKRDLKPRKNTSNESDESKLRSVWSDLSDDIVRHIIGKNCWSDGIRSSAVCRSLRSLVHGIQIIDTFPWLMCYNWRKTDYGRVYGICRLVDPSAQKSYVIEEAIKGEERFDFVHAVPCTSRNGWVLFQDSTLFFFYSPFTNEVIKLPEMDLNLLNHTDYMKATFSSNPTSTDCVVLVLSVGFCQQRISTWSLGDKTWTHSDLRIKYRALHMIYADGIFYVIFEGGKLGAYNAVLKEWKLFANVLPVTLKGAGDATAYFIESNEDKATAYFMESNEDKGLLLMCAFVGHWELWRFDLSSKCWVKEQRIGNRAIFLGCTSYSVPAVGTSSKFADKIYGLEEICRNKQPMCASLENRKLWLQTELYSWMPKIGAEKLIWIQPPLQ